MPKGAPAVLSLLACLSVGTVSLALVQVLAELNPNRGVHAAPGLVHRAAAARLPRNRRRLPSLLHVRLVDDLG
jgi:hypothetical protein